VTESESQAKQIHKAMRKFYRQVFVVRTA